MFKGYRVKRINGEVCYLRGPWSKDYFDRLKQEASDARCVKVMDERGYIKTLNIRELTWDGKEAIHI